MANWVTLDPQVHAGCAWRVPTDFSFARRLVQVPVTLGEIMASAVSLPLVLNAGGMPFGLLSSGNGLHSSPMITRYGQWRGCHVPNALRLYPFAPGPAGAILIDADALRSGGGDALPLYDTSGALASDVATRLPDLHNVGADELRTQNAGDALQRAGVMIPHSSGLGFGIDQVALAQVGRVALAKLHHSGALLLAYAVILSQANLAVFLAAEQAQQRVLPAPRATALDDFIGAVAQDCARSPLAL